ncbi:MAG: GGDEF domain-containing protein [Gammaproteobacteria bacterium]
MNIAAMSPAESEKLLYKLVIQFLIFSQGRHKSLEPHLLQVRKRLKAGASLSELSQELQALSKTLLHIAKQDEQNKTKDVVYWQNDFLLQKIDELLANTSVPIRFQQKKAALRRWVKADATDQSFKQIIDSAVSLLLDIKDYFASEHNGIESFLAGLSKQLSEIEQHAELVGQSTRLSIDQRQELDSEINQRMDHFMVSTSEADELASLKAVTAEHLDRLMTQLVAYKQLEDERQIQAEREIASMTVKLHALETETEALRTKLRIEHDRALCDDLTGMPNRLAFKDRAEMETNRWKRYHAPLSLLIWDIDYFKRINDNYGHKAGDKTLALVGQILSNNCRASDFVARYGGEEFLMLLPNTTADQALKMADNIREIIENSGFNHNRESLNLTISCGISEFSGDDKHDDVFVRADRALYQAKQAGRNRCVLYDGANDKCY